jgi:hypothetical protein
MCAHEVGRSLCSLPACILLNFLDRTSPKASTVKSWITVYVLDERTQITMHDQINLYLISSLSKHQLAVQGGQGKRYEMRGSEANTLINVHPPINT